MRLAAWATASVGTLALDLLWLGVLARGFYRREFGHLMAERVTWPAAFAFYVLYGAGVAYFCVQPAQGDSGARTAAFRGAMLGLLVYGTYDLTNMAVLRDWSVKGACVDVLWGVFLTAAVSAAASLNSR